MVVEFLGHFHLKANVCKKVLFSQKDILPGEILLIKKLDFEKTKLTYYIQILKLICIIKMVLVFSISNFFTNKNSQERKSVREKKYLILQIRL